MMKPVSNSSEAAQQGQNVKSTTDFDNAETIDSNIQNFPEGVRKRKIGIVIPKTQDTVVITAMSLAARPGAKPILDRRERVKNFICDTVSSWKFKVILPVSIGLIGFILGYFVARVVVGDGLKDVEILAEDFDKVSRTSDGRRCRTVINRVPTLVAKFELRTVDIVKVASNFEYEDRHIAQLFTTYIATAAKAKENKRSNRTSGTKNLHKAALNTFMAIDKTVDSSSSKECAFEAFKSIISTIIDLHVTAHKEVVFNRTWNVIARAITFSSLTYWKATKTESRKAISMMKRTFGNNSSKYEVYGWAKYINEVAKRMDPFTESQKQQQNALLEGMNSTIWFKNAADSMEKLGIDVDELLEDSKVSISSSEALNLAEDKLAHTKFNAVMTKLFPF